MSKPDRKLVELANAADEAHDSLKKAERLKRLAEAQIEGRRRELREANTAYYEYLHSVYGERPVAW